MLVTTHYMDEAERCHRLAFIFRGELLAIGTPDEMVAARDLRVVELEVDVGAGDAAAALLRALPAVDEVAHYGHALRVARARRRRPSRRTPSCATRSSPARDRRSTTRPRRRARHGRGRVRRRWCARTTAASASAEARMTVRPLVIAWKELLQLRRDRLTLAMMVVLPVMQLLAVRLRDQHRRAPHPDGGLRPGSAAPRRATWSRSMEATGFYDLVGRGRELRRDRPRAALRHGARRAGGAAALRVERLRAGSTAQVQLVVDGSDPQTVASATNTAASLVARALAELLVERAGAQRGQRRCRPAPHPARAHHLVQPRPPHRGLRRARAWSA